MSSGPSRGGVILAAEILSSRARIESLEATCAAQRFWIMVLLVAFVVAAAT